MGLGGLLLFLSIAGVVSYIFLTEKTFQKRSAHSENPFAGMAKISVQMVKAPEELTERMTPKWLRDLSEKLRSEGYVFLGDYSYASTLFFWSHTFLAPDHKSALLFTNWVEGKEGGKVVISNLEIYSFDGNSFIVTACAQDGAAKLLTGANRPREDQMSLHLKAVFAESSVRPIVQEHQKRIAEWEGRGAKVRELNRENVIPSLSKIFS